MSTKLTLCLAIFLGCTSLIFAQEEKSLDEHYLQVSPVQTQLDGYNTGNIDLFLSAYSDSVKIYNYPDEFQYQGKEKMRERYGSMFKNLPDLHCMLVSRMVMGNKVLDQEFVTFRKGQKPAQVVAIYTVEEGKITEVRFVR